MIKLENTEVLGWEAAIRGMRNPMNSWGKSDSIFVDSGDESLEYHDIHGNSGPWPHSVTGDVVIGSDDKRVMMNLAKAGSVDAKYRRMIVVTMDITAPLYWWKEFDAYKVGTVANSCSTMHKIHAKEFTLDDFSHEHLISLGGMVSYGDALHHLKETIKVLNYYRECYQKVEGSISRKKEYWWQLIQLLPSSYNQRRTVMLNYEVLAGIYPHRKDHKLDEWHEFCDWIKSLPYSEIITLEE